MTNIYSPAGQPESMIRMKKINICNFNSANCFPCIFIIFQCSFCRATEGKISHSPLSFPPRTPSPPSSCPSALHTPIVLDILLPLTHLHSIKMGKVSTLDTCRRMFVVFDAMCAVHARCGFHGPRAVRLPRPPPPSPLALLCGRCASREEPC